MSNRGDSKLHRAKRLLILEGIIVTAGTQTDSDFAFAGLATPEAEATAAIKALAAGPDPLGALAGLLGTWKGNGFNAIWRPHNPANQQDRFLELNKTDETLVFTRINGPIPNRGLAMADIDMFGLTYMQQISESSTGAGLHIEPGIWATVPQTADPNEPASVVRMASIPHGTVILAQGVAQVHPGGPQTHPGQQHPAVLLRQPGAREQRLQLRGPDVHRAEPVPADPVPLRGSRGDAEHRQEPQQRAAGRTPVLASGHDHEEPDVPARGDQSTASSRPAAAPPTRRSWPRAAILPEATPRPRRPRRRSGSRRSPAPGASRTSTSCSTRSW